MVSCNNCRSDIVKCIICGEFVYEDGVVGGSGDGGCGGGGGIGSGDDAVSVCCFVRPAYSFHLDNFIS